MEELTADDPRTLGRYRVVARIGSGGMGRVLLGHDETGREVALKIVHRQRAADPGFRARFRREIQAAAMAPTWFAAAVLDADPDADEPWLATAYIPGVSLAEFVTGQGPVPAGDALEFAVRMADGLVALHSAGLVHRDIKPSNVLLADDGPRLIDFGIARATDQTALTRSGEVVGTAEFMSPEQASGQYDVGPASDVFSFCSLLAFAVNGRSPFAADTAAGSLYRIVYADPDLGMLTGSLRQVAAAGLAKDPAARPSAAQLRDRLRTLGPAGGPATAPPGGPDDPTARIGPSAPSPPAHRQARRRWRPATALTGAALAGAVIALAGAYAFSVFSATPFPAPDPVRPVGPTTTAAPVTPAGPDPFDGAQLIDADQFGDTPRFQTPSGNIACVMGSDVRCDVRERVWDIPPAPPGCAFAWGGGTTIRATGAAELTCVGDTIIDPGLPVLRYDQAVEHAGVACVSRESGVTCEHRQSGHGFTISRARYDLR